jgi:hypothetical protein
MPSLYVKHHENKRVFYLIPLKKQFDGKTAYLDITDRARKAINKDRRQNYGIENGPNFGLEVLHAVDYADHVADVAHPKNLHKFGTRTGYSFFISALTDDQIKRDRARRTG